MLDRVQPRRIVAVAAALAGAALVAGALGGCYTRVTQARGLGADQYEVSEPYQRNSQLDDWIFGKQEPTRRPGSMISP